MFGTQHSASSAAPREILTAWIRLSSYGAPHLTPVRSRPGGPKDDSPRREPWVGVVCTESAPAGRQKPTTPESCTSPELGSARGNASPPHPHTLPRFPAPPRLRAPAGKSPPPPRATGESQVSRLRDVLVLLLVLVLEPMNPLNSRQSFSGSSTSTTRTQLET